jgi:hypothetical protein
VANPQHPTTEATMHVLVTRDSRPAISATASIVYGTESLFAHLEVDDMPTDRARHACRLTISGRRVDVLGVLDQLRAAVVAAPVPITAQDQDEPPLLTRPHDWPDEGGQR